MSGGKNRVLGLGRNSINKITTGVKADCQQVFYREILEKVIPREPD